MTDNIHLNIQDTVADRINVSIQEASIHLELGGYVGGGGGSGGVAIEGSGSYMQDTGTVKFSNTPEIRFGLATNGVMTASHNALASSLTTQFVGTGTTITNASATLNSNGMQLNIPEGRIYFMDADGVSWNSSVSALSTSISASVNTVGGGGSGAALKGSGVYTQNTGTIEFANSNDITFGLTDNQMTASFSQSTHEHPYLDSGDSTYYQTSNLSSVFLTTAALSDHSHGDVTLELTNLTGTISSASSGITLSLSADNAAADQTAISGIGIRADISETSLNTTYTSGTVIWQGNQFISISHSTNGASQYVLLSVGDYLTTAMASNAGSNFVGLGSTLTTTTGTDVAMTFNSDGLNLAVPAYITTYAAGGGEIDISAGGSSDSLASLVFSDSNGVSFGLAGSTVTASVSHPTQSQMPSVISVNESSGSLSISAGANITVSNTDSTIIIEGVGALWSLYGDYETGGSHSATSFSSGSVRIYNGMGDAGIGIYVNTGSGSINMYITHDLALANHTHSDLYIPLGDSTFYQTTNLSSIFQTTGAYLTTAAESNHSHSQYLTTAMASENTSIFINTSNSGNFQLTSDNTLSLGTGYTTHTHDYQSTAAYLTTAMQSVCTSVFQLTADNSLSLDTGYTTHTHNYQSTGAYLTTAMASDNGSNFAGVGSSTGSTAGSELAITYNSNGLSLGMPAWITAGGAGGGVAIAGSGSTETDGTVVFSASNGITFGLSDYTMTASVADNIGSLGFADSNNVTFGIASTTSNSSTVVTASIPAFIGTATTITTTSGTDLKITAGTAGFNIAHPVWITTAAAGGGTELVPGDYLSSTLDGSTLSISVTGLQATSATSAITASAVNTSILTDLQYTSAMSDYITTAALSNHTHSDLYIALANSTDYATSVLSGTFQTTGAYLTTAAESNHSHSQYLTTAMASEDSSLFQSTGDYLTTAAASDHTHDQYVDTSISSQWLTGYTESTHNFTQYVGLLTTSISGGSATINSSQLILNIPSNAGSLGFADSNGVTFGVASTTSNSSTVVTASIATNYAASNHTHSQYLTAAGGGVWSVATTNAGTNIIISTASDTNTLYHPAFITTYTPGGGGADWSISSTAGTDVVISTATNTITFYQPSFLTGYTESTHDFTQYVGLTSTAITGGSATIASNQLLINIPSNAGSLGFADSNGVSFGVASTTSNSSTVVTASYNLIWSLVSNTGGSVAGTASSGVSVLKLVAGSGVTLSGGSNGITILA